LFFLSSSMALRPVLGPWPLHCRGLRDSWVFTKWRCSPTPKPQPDEPRPLSLSDISLKTCPAWWSNTTWVAN
jgi:hypothetical protein